MPARPCAAPLHGSPQHETRRHTLTDAGSQLMFFCVQPCTYRMNSVKSAQRVRVSRSHCVWCVCAFFCVLRVRVALSSGQQRERRPRARRAKSLPATLQWYAYTRPPLVPGNKLRDSHTIRSHHTPYHAPLLRLPPLALLLHGDQMTSSFF